LAITDPFHDARSADFSGGGKSALFGGKVGETLPAGGVPPADYLIDESVCDSEGNWAFCRFLSDEVYAARLGFQKGSFNILEHDQPADPSLLQLHLELMTRDGAVLWIPTGSFDARKVSSSRRELDVRFEEAGREIFSIRGWPTMRWRFQSSEGEVEADLEFTVASVSLLPDCVLPHCIFAMWETMGDARGTVRFRDRTTEVRGKVFYDHPRIRHQRNQVEPRRWYLYTTMFLEDGSGFFGYHAEDTGGHPLAYYCFGVYVDAAGRGTYLPEARLRDLRITEHNTPGSWRLDWRGPGAEIDARITVKPTELLASWGSPIAPKTAKDFIILPLVLDGAVTVRREGRVHAMKGCGLAEYFNADFWSA